jgi:hypothetical protein
MASSSTLESFQSIIDRYYGGKSAFYGNINYAKLKKTNSWSGDNLRWVIDDLWEERMQKETPPAEPKSNEWGEIAP